MMVLIVVFIGLIFNFYGFVWFFVFFCIIIMFFFILFLFSIVVLFSEFLLRFFVSGVFLLIMIYCLFIFLFNYFSFCYDLNVSSFLKMMVRIMRKMYVFVQVLVLVGVYFVENREVDMEFWKMVIMDMCVFMFIELFGFVDVVVVLVVVWFEWDLVLWWVQSNGFIVLMLDG